MVSADGSTRGSMRWFSARPTGSSTAVDGWLEASHTQCPNPYALAGPPTTLLTASSRAGPGSRHRWHTSRCQMMRSTHAHCSRHCVVLYNVYALLTVRRACSKCVRCLLIMMMDAASQRLAQQHHVGTKSTWVEKSACPLRTELSVSSATTRMQVGRGQQLQVGRGQQLTAAGDHQRLDQHDLDHGA